MSLPLADVRVVAVDVVVLDVAMPGRNGIEVAEAVADDWPDDRAEPLFVFVTAFDEFAVSAFERAAVDYVLKPATAERLRQTVQRLKARLAGRKFIMVLLDSVGKYSCIGDAERIRQWLISADLTSQRGTVGAPLTAAMPAAGH